MVRYFSIADISYKHFYHLIWILLLSGLMACSTEDDIPIPEPPVTEETDPYFLKITDRIVWSRESFAERLKLDPSSALLALLPEKEIITESILYRTEDPTEERVEASGIITYPTDGKFKGVVVSHHYSIGSNDEAPSSVMATIESGLALFGYLVITPDYLGFGSTRDLPQTYLHAETAGQISVDMVFAIREYMDSLEMNMDQKSLNVVGYSQGAYSALAFTRKAEAEYQKEIAISRVFAGGGPYEPASMFDLFLEQDEIDNPATVLLTVIGLDYGDQLNLNYSNVFQEPLLSNYREWCISKKYTLGQINRNLGTKKLSEFMHPDMFASSMNADLGKMMQSLEQNNLIEWAPKASLLLVHGTKDQTVPYINAENALAAFQKAGSSVKLISVNSDHQETAISFFLQVLFELGL